MYILLCVCVSRLALYIRFFPCFFSSFTCVFQVNCFFSFFLKKPSPIIVLLLLLSTGLSHTISTILVFLLMMMIMLVFEAWRIIVQIGWWTCTHTFKKKKLRCALVYRYISFIRCFFFPFPVFLLLRLCLLL